MRNWWLPVTRWLWCRSKLASWQPCFCYHSSLGRFVFRGFLMKRQQSVPFSVLPYVGRGHCQIYWLMNLNANLDFGEKCVIFVLRRRRRCEISSGSSLFLFFPRVLFRHLVFFLRPTVFSVLTFVFSVPAFRWLKPSAKVSGVSEFIAKG